MTNEDLSLRDLELSSEVEALRGSFRWAKGIHSRRPGIFFRKFLSPIIFLARDLWTFLRRNRPLQTRASRPFGVILQRLEGLFITLSAGTIPNMEVAEFSDQIPYTSKLKPRVTIVVTIYNQSPSQIAQCFRGILRQTYSNFEVVVVDDGSTNPETLSYIREFRKSIEPIGSWTFIRVENSGVVRARNLGLKEAKGDWICFHDPDDELLPLFLATLINGLIANSNDRFVGVVHSDVLVCDPSGQTHVWNTRELSRFVVASRNTLPVTCIARTRFVRAVGGFSETFSKGLEDWALWATFASHRIRSVRIAEPLYVYNICDSGRNKTIGEAENELRRSIRGIPFRAQPKLQSEVWRHQETQIDETLGDVESLKRRVVFFVPWLLDTGGAELFLKVLADGLTKNGVDVFFVLTHPESRNHWVGKSEMSRITPNIYDLSSCPSSREVSVAMESVFNTDATVTVFNAGSEWHYRHVRSLNVCFSSKRIRNFALLFNSGIHAGRYLRSIEHFGGAVTVYEKLGEALSAIAPNKRALSITVGTIESSKAPRVRTEFEYGIPHFGWLGRMDEDKNPSLFAELARRYSGKARFSMAGSGPLLDSMRSVAEGIPSLTVLGRVEDVTDYMNTLDALVITSNIEGISNVAVEAISNGVPVISTDVGGMSELIQEGINGYLYPKSSADSLGSILQSLLENSAIKLKKLREKTVQAGLPHSYTKEAMVSAYLDFLNEKKVL